MSTSNNNEKQANLAKEMSQFKTVAAAKAWWSNKTPAERGAILGIIVGSGMGLYTFFVAYKVVGISAAIWNAVLYGAIAGACTTSIATAYHATPENIVKANELMSEL